MWASILLTGVMVLFLHISFVSAVGVASGFSAKVPLEAYPGEERTILLILQNTDVEDDATVEGKILEGSDIVSLDREKFTVPFKELVTAKLKVQIPESVSVGDQFTVRYEFKHVAAEVEEGGEGTGAAFSQGVVRSFKVNVVEKPAEVLEEEVSAVATGESRKSAVTILLWAILVVVILILIVWFVIRKKSSVGVNMQASASAAVTKK